MSAVGAFSIARLPKIEFGAGAISKLPGLINLYGKSVLIVTGAKSFIDSQHWLDLQQQFTSHSIQHKLFTVITEPSPQLIDDAVSQYRNNNIDIVVAIGGGSAIDAGKAIAGLLKINNSVMDFLEGVGPELGYIGPSVPFIAVPTTAGTGSEATKNSVIGEQSYHGFKKSFRHENLTAEYAVLDPNLLISCPINLIAANGMDALTQLMESYLSLNANTLTDCLALDGLIHIKSSLLAWYQGDNSEIHRSRMAYASLLSGINLAQTGLGSVHGLASPLGAFFPIPHGVVCGTLVAVATAVNIKALRERDPKSKALIKYATLGRLFTEKERLSTTEACDALVEYLQTLTDELDFPGLKEYGLRADQLDHVVANSRGSSMKTNPIVLTDDEVRDIVFSRL